jgi:hypothetical protein
MLNEVGIDHLMNAAIEPCLHAAAIFKQHLLNLPADLHASLDHWLHLDAAFQGSGGGGPSSGTGGTATIVGGAAVGGAAGGAVIEGGKSAGRPGTD